MKNKKLPKYIFAAAILFVLVFAVILIVNLINQGSSEALSYDQAVSKLETKLSKMDGNVIEQDLIKSVSSGAGEGNSLADSLPDISEYPLMVAGNSELVIEIASSTEKSGTGTDGAFNEVAKSFNAEKLTVNGKQVSVSIRSIASGEAIDYIVSGKYVPQAYSPSNQLWGQMLEANGVSVQLLDEGLAGNVAGLVLAKDTYDSFTQSYGEVTIENVLAAIESGDLSFGYTNPYSSSTGLNFLTTLLNHLDSGNPLSGTAKDGFTSFQENVSLVSYSTIQLRNSVKKGSVNAFVYEYQNFVNTAELKDYVFTPFGVRHDNPIYALGDLSSQEQDALRLFIDYCENEDSQRVFESYGFNQDTVASYEGADTGMNGNTIIAAQQLWKEEKNVRPIAVVFVADVSGSMIGTPLNNLKESLMGVLDDIDSAHSVGMVSYSDNVFIDLPIAEYDEDQKTYFRGAVDYMSASGGTATNNAILVALDMLKTYQETNPNVKPMIILLSDGEQNKGYDLGDVKNIIAGMSISIHTVGYNATIANLQEISEITESATINASTEDVIYRLKLFFNAEL